MNGARNDFGVSKSVSANGFPVRLAALLLCLVLTACANRPENGALAVSSAPAPGASVQDILIVTTRQRDERPDTYFNGERAAEADYAKASISVPPTHEDGLVEWPSSLPGDPKTDFVTRSASFVPNRAAMIADLNARLMKLPKGERSVFLFIHGYNTLFAEGLYRFAQIAHDANYGGVPVLFTWASRGDLTDYVYDLNSAMTARSALEQTVEDLSRSKAERIFILAHSMGNMLLMETARQMTPEQLRRLEPKIDQIALAAPDIDIDVFKEQLRAISEAGRPSKPFIIFVSRDDRALRLSKTIAGGKQRVGAYESDKELAELGAVVVDLTDLDSLDAANHAKFAQVASISPELRAVLQQRNLQAANPREPGQLGQVGQDLGTFVSSTAQVAITLPVTLITAPIALATGGL
ncbi:alpha/beta hydrolase [Roseibium sp.]|uniref:alpha/beta hydrolase n=1 Tax=Roseibium sp. TaxID=1936156 RepID=UPI003A982DE1